MIVFNWVERWASFIFYFCFLVSLALNAYLVHDLQVVIDKAESLQFYDKKIGEVVAANGIYFNGGFYCVNTRGRDFKRINKTEYHEACHALIAKDFEHFCE